MTIEILIKITVYFLLYIVVTFITLFTFITYYYVLENNNIKKD